MTSVEGFEFLLDPSAQRLSFLLNQAYLASGFDAVTGASEALKVNICIPARALARIMWQRRMRRPSLPVHTSSSKIEIDRSRTWFLEPQGK